MTKELELLDKKAGNESARQDFLNAMEAFNRTHDKAGHEVTGYDDLRRCWMESFDQKTGQLLNKAFDKFLRPASIKIDKKDIVPKAHECGLPLAGHGPCCMRPPLIAAGVVCRGPS